MPADGAKPVEAFADPTGRFDIDLPAGEWKLYVNGTGREAYHSKMTVQPADDRVVMVVSR